MTRRVARGVLGLALSVGVACLVMAATPPADAPPADVTPAAEAPPAQVAPLGNAYYLYTAALGVGDEGVVAVPDRYRFSVETSWRGLDARGQDLPDSRLLLRLYDPDQNWTAMTAQLDLATARKLHRELGELIARKTADPAFQHRPALYDPSQVPVGRLEGIDASGKAQIRFEGRAR